MSNLDNFDIDLRKEFIKKHQTEIEKRVVSNRNFRRINEYSEYILGKEHPIKQDVILYDSFLGKSMTDNPYAIFLEILKKDVHHKYHHVWILENPENVQSSRFSELTNVEFIRPYTKKHLQYLATAKYLIINTSMPYYFVKRPDQILINMWHGTPIKGMGKYMGGRFGQWANVQRQFLMTDYMVHPNEYTQNIMNDSYDLNGIYDGIQLTVGYPRVDLIQTTDKENFFNFLNRIVPIEDDKKIVLYAPTWRGNQESVSNMTEEFVQNSLDIQNALPEGYQLLVKAHQIAYDKAKSDRRIKDILVPNDVDTSELLSVTDVLISDYSSIFFDYLVTGKPVFLYAYDLESYIADRGLLLDINSVPGNVVLDIEELANALANLEDYTMNNSNRVSEYIKWQTGHAATRIIDELFENKDEVEYEYEVKINNNRKNVVLYLDGFENNDYYSKVQFINSLTENIDSNIILLTKDHLSNEELLLLSQIRIKYNHIFRLGQVNYTVDNYVTYSLTNQGDMSMYKEENVQNILKEEIRRIVPLKRIDHFIYLGKMMDVFENNLFAFGITATNKTYVKTNLFYNDQKTRINVSKNKHIIKNVLPQYDEIIDLTAINSNPVVISQNKYIPVMFNNEKINVIKLKKGRKLMIIANNFSDFDELFGIYNLQRIVAQNYFDAVYIYGNEEIFGNYFKNEKSVYLIDSKNISLMNLLPLALNFSDLMLDTKDMNKYFKTFYSYIVDKKINIIDMNV
ncbi:hypothetical protein G9403_01625 [Weissella paramesenteroides]|uniref:Uncharacterized protein n=1 Tax=Weissella paramesenteroides TaxID=1249 RepID=A0ABD4XGD7_WEIPA|nr:CDP-glycerol glycerophosphotransferase family protein [Weissella paramesenteroides]MDF8368452.1 hypothetical protein [Weissella paramesenteroides]MDF8370359.1 hypothetical protein [Weissella paramesenteroides]